MDTKKILIPVVVVVIGLLVWSYGWQDKASEPGLSDSLTSAQSETKPWIEVEVAEVNEVDATGKVLGAYATGDLVEEGSIIVSNATGLATIYFADGSALRIEPSTTLTITEGQYDSQSGSLRVRVALSVGKVWSKITALATPESHWEVNTGSAVATVRGSAFGTEVTGDGETLIVGSEHDIAVAPIDLNTGEVLNDQEIVVNDKEAVRIKSDRKIVKEKRDIERLRTWVESNEKRDNVVSVRVMELRKEGLRGREFSEAIRENIKAEIEVRRAEREVKLQDKREIIEDRRIEANLNPNSKIEATRVELKSEISRPNIVRLEVVSGLSELKVAEGTVLEFKAVAILADGSKKDVTALATWQVVGQIGSFERPGMFRARLGASVAELGSSFGAVAATFKNDNVELVGKSDVLTVTAKVEEATDLRG